MWFRRLLRRRPKPPAFDLSGLDRLEELIARVIALLPEQHVAPATTLPEPGERPRAEPAPSAHLLLLPGYVLLARDGPAPVRGELVEQAGRAYRVVRHGPSPLPADGRRCAFLELAQLAAWEERLREPRTFGG